MSGRATTDRTGTILDRVLERTWSDLEERRRRRTAAELGKLAGERSDPLDFRAALAGPGVSVIAEVKRGSPSRGRFPVELDPALVAAEYLAGGAAAISVLTDRPFFHGSLADLEAVAEVAHAATPPRPVLRKDFLIDTYQVIEARAYGADALLLIVAALDDRLLVELLELTRSLGMAALIEVHDEAEMERAIAAGADVIGINNRDLRTFAVDLATTERLAPLAPEGAVVVGESGVFGRDDVLRLERAGVAAVLVGEGVIVAPDRAAAVAALRGEEPGR